MADVHAFDVEVFSNIADADLVNNRRTLSFHVAVPVIEATASCGMRDELRAEQPFLASF
jgi:hypothetical protein